MYNHFSPKQYQSKPELKKNENSYILAATFISNVQLTYADVEVKVLFRPVDNIQPKNLL